MKVLVVGANGQIGRQFVQMLDKSGTHTPKAMVRRQDQVSFFKCFRRGDGIGQPRRQHR